MGRKNRAAQNDGAIDQSKPQAADDANADAGAAIVGGMEPEGGIEPPAATPDVTQNDTPTESAEAPADVPGADVTQAQAAAERENEAPPINTAEEEARNKRVAELQAARSFGFAALRAKESELAELRTMLNTLCADRDAKVAAIDAEIGTVRAALEALNIELHTKTRPGVIKLDQELAALQG